MDSKSRIYDRRGVSSLKEEVAAAVRKNPLGVFSGAFCKAVTNPFSLSGDTLFLFHADGTGSKSALAYLYWKETGDLSVFKGLAQDAIVMNTDDLLSVGCIDNFYFSSTLARNKHRIPGEVLSALVEGGEEFLTTMQGWGIACELMGGETADLGDVVKTLTVDMSAVTFIEKNQFIDTSRIKPGLAIIGLSSTGQTSYENTYNSGIASNGLTSARHDLLISDYRTAYPETYDENTSLDMVYMGRYRVGDPLEGTPLNLGQALLSPTRTYLPVIKKMLLEYPEAITAILHLTGGGQTKCLKFGEGIHYYKDNLFPLPPLFRLLAESPLYREAQAELYQVFNCGHRLELYVEERWIEPLLKIAEGFHLPAQVVGYTESIPSSKGSEHLSRSPSGNALTLKTDGNEYHYR